MHVSSLTPMLTVSDAAAARDFYKRAFGATEEARFQAPSGQLVIQMSIDGWRFFAVDENPQAFNLSPRTLGGTSVRLNLVVEDADATVAQSISAGATEVFPVADQPYGLPRAG